MKILKIIIPAIILSIATVAVFSLFSPDIFRFKSDSARQAIDNWRVFAFNDDLKNLPEKPESEIKIDTGEGIRVDTEFIESRNFFNLESKVTGVGFPFTSVLIIHENQCCTYPKFIESSFVIFINGLIWALFYFIIISLFYNIKNNKKL